MCETVNNTNKMFSLLESEKIGGHIGWYGNENCTGYHAAYKNHSPNEVYQQPVKKERF